MSTVELKKNPPAGPVRSEAAIELVAQRFAVLAEPMRLRLLQALFAGEKSVGGLVRETGGTQTNVSRHLQTLMHANMIARRRDGLQVYYSITDPTIAALCEQVCGSLRQQLAQQAGALGG